MNAYTYNDVLIKPAYSEIASRNDVDLRTTIGNTNIRLPVISANMKTITGPKMASEVIIYGGMGILHRFCSIEENVEMFNKTIKLFSICGNHPILDNVTNKERTGRLGVSIGVKDEDKKRFDTLYEAGARVFCIDVAHGHHIHVKNMLKWITDTIFLWDRSQLKNITLIAGNIATPEAYRDLCSWGANAAKVGIGPSPVCRTRYNTGVGVPQLHALETIYRQMFSQTNPISIIADGGISHVGDIAKALRYSDAVMLGSMIAGTSETPGEVYRNEDTEYYKVYGGSASAENKGENRFSEGIIKTVKFRGKVKYIIREIQQGLQSAFSYVGTKNHIEYQQKCKFNIISAGAQRESKI